MRRSWRSALLSAAVLVSALSVPTPAVATSSHVLVRIPNVVGTPAAHAKQILTAAHLGVTTIGPGAHRASESVVRMQPRAGSLVRPNATITLVIGRHRANHVRVPRLPNLLGRGPAYVRLVARQHHLRLVILKVGAVHGSWNRVVAQLPAAGVATHRHQQLILAVSQARRHVVKNIRRPAHRATAHPAPKIVVTRLHRGIATWYGNVRGQCATWYLPIGTRIWIQDLQNGRVVSCVASDREGSHGDRAVDLSKADFSSLAPPTQGVIPVRVWW